MNEANVNKMALCADLEMDLMMSFMLDMLRSEAASPLIKLTQELL